MEALIAWNREGDQRGWEWLKFNQWSSSKKLLKKSLINDKIKTLPLRVAILSNVITILSNLGCPSRAKV